MTHHKITHSMPDYKAILVVGSSTSLGAHDEEGLGWAARFNRLLALHHPNPRYLVANAGVSGHTTRDGYNNLVNAVGLHDPHYVIIALGTNDVLVHEGLEPESEFISRTASLQAYLSIIDYVKLNSLKPLFIGPQPVERDCVRFAAHNNRLEAHTSFRYDNDRLKRLNDDLEILCTKENVPFLRLFEDWQKRSDLWSDGLHPNAKGHQLWAEQVYQKFAELYLPENA